MAESAPTSISPRTFAIWNAVVSVAAMSFLVWLVYFHEGGEPGPGKSSLPFFNALFNGMAATLLLTGRAAIRAGQRRLHKNLMIAAFVCSALFLVNYITYHYSVGDTKFVGTGAIRPVYFFILISHIGLSAIVFPAILWAFYLALSERIARHRQVARYTWAGWMYVSVTGIVIYLMLHVIEWGP